MAKRPTGFYVLEKRCDQCLFSKQRIVSEERMRDVLATCEREGTHFTCHKATIAGNQDVCCRGFYDREPFATAGMRLAAHLGIVYFITEEAIMLEDRSFGERLTRELYSLAIAGDTWRGRHEPLMFQNQPMDGYHSIGEELADLLTLGEHAVSLLAMLYTVPALRVKLIGPIQSIVAAKEETR